MDIAELISSICKRWPEYRAGRKTDAGNAAHGLVYSGFPAELERLAVNAPELKFFGSSGLGNVSAAPWIATFDPRITTSAQNGY